jgi:hypothetical protein
MTREMLIHCHAAYLTEAKRRRGQGNFYWLLLDWAANCRRRLRAEVVQGELF